MKCELWISESGYSFFPEENESARRLLESNAKLVKIIEAATWEEACAKKHAFLGWEPYKPMDAT
jgi:hypothetical protein